MNATRKPLEEESRRSVSRETHTWVFRYRFNSIRIGEPAELLVISKGATFYAFKALQEAYLPESGAWLARYPFMDKDVFLDISLDIERERRQQDDEQEGEQDADGGTEFY